MRTTLLVRTCSMIALLVGSASIAHAQAAPAGAPASDVPAATETHDIIVTAEKRSASALKVPIALSVFSGDALKTLGVTSVSSLSQLAPGLEIGSASHGPAIAIRGISATDTTSKGEQNVVFSVDGVPVGRSQLTGLAFFDLERVEVLRGPQGTLYGKSSTGGVINVITAKPVDHLEASLSAELGNYNTRRATAMINLPLTDNLAVRAAFNVNQRDGFLKPVLGVPLATSQSQQNLGAENNWTSRLSAKLRFGTDGSLVVTGTFGHIGGAGDANSANYAQVLNGKGDDRFKVYYNPVVGNRGLNDHFANVNGELNFSVGPVHVTYVGGYQWWHGYDNFDPSVTDASVTGVYTFNQYDSHLTTNSHEVRLSNAEPGRLEWTLGANYIKESNDEVDLNWNVAASCAPALTQFVNGVACALPNPNIVGPTYHQAKGVFGQATFAVTDKLKITGGLRYSSDKVERNATVAAGPTPTDGFLAADGTLCGPYNGSACVGPVGTGSVTNDSGSNSTSKVTWRADVKYQFNPSLMGYATVATGYKSGGFNDIDPDHPGQTGAYGAEAVTDYEIGLKGRISSQLTIDTDVYYYDYSKYQLTGAAFFAPGATGGAPAVLIYTSLAPVTLYGWEGTVNYRPTSHDTFTGSVVLQHGFFNHGANAAAVGFVPQDRVSWAGKELDRLPRIAVNLAWDHTVDLIDGAQLRFHVNSKISSSYKVSDLGGSATDKFPGPPFLIPSYPNPYDAYYQPPQQYTQAAYTRTDATIGYTTASGKLGLEVFVKNIENKVQLQSAPTTLQPGWNDAARSVRINMPRTFGVRFNMKY